MLWRHFGTRAQRATELIFVGERRLFLPARFWTGQKERVGRITRLQRLCLV